MFSIPSLQKLLVLVAIIMAVWTAFKFIGQMDKARRGAGGVKRKSIWPWPTRADTGDASSRIEQTQKCPKCGAYVPTREPTACGRADCPY